MKKSTIKDVAKIANVSEATVSRVMSNSNLISNKTKKKVMEVVRQLDYFPNSAAVSLTKSKSNILGLVVVSSAKIENPLQNDYYNEIIPFISKYALDLGYYTLYLQFENKEEAYENVYRLIKSNRIDGLIFLNFIEDKEHISYFEKISFPYAIIGTPNNKTKGLWIDNDNIKSCFDITNKLIQKGKKNLLFISGPSDMSVSVYRKKGYLDALKKNDINFESENILSLPEFSSDLAYNNVENYNNIDKIDAIITTDDILAIGAKKAIDNLGLDIEVTGFNNSKLRSYLNYKFTTVDIKYDKLAKGVIYLLTSKIAEKELKSNYIVVESEIIER
ncbi:LacI family DNA-binding transcriptional regulator [Pseudostreptobacillus sp.]